MASTRSSNPGRTSLWNIVYLAVIAEVVLWIDLGVKHLVRSQLSTGETLDYQLGEQGFVFLVHLPNSGISLGLFRNANMLVTYLGIFAVFVILAIDLLRNRQIGLGRFGLALLLGGILGNLIDRIAFGYVTDIFMFYGLPVFNLADIFIAGGVVYLVVDLLLRERQNQLAG
jgi:signal peptidase II